MTDCNYQRIRRVTTAREAKESQDNAPLMMNRFRITAREDEEFE
jgi:hypothetical protein